MNSKSSNIYIVHDGINKILSYANLKKSIQIICQKINAPHLNVDRITSSVYSKLKTHNTLREIDDQIIATTSELVIEHYDYPRIAVWLLINNLHQNTHNDYVEVVRELRANVNIKGKSAPIVSEEFANFVYNHHKEINDAFCYERDYDITIFGFRTLEKSYLKKLVNGKIVERPQHMYMRVAIALHYRDNDLNKIIESYHLLSKGYFTHATPTLFNAGTCREQLSSCFLLGIEDDMEGIGECWKDCAIISKYAGGIGINVSNIRAEGSYIHSTQGIAGGMRLLSVFNQIARYADQGGKRAGSIAIYLEPWHGDIFFFLELKKNTGAETERTRDLFLALMINDIFMKRVEEDGIWSLMCPSECPDLLNKYGDEFTRVYINYEKQRKFIKQVPARDVWFKIMESQIETGVPYIVFKDAVNYKSNQINIGVVNGSNLCVSGDTKILTSNGYMEIQGLENKEVDVWNGESFSTTTIRKTGIQQKLLQVEFSNGSILKCTPYHKFYVKNGDCTIELRAHELQQGDILINHQLPFINYHKIDHNVDCLGFHDNLQFNKKEATIHHWLNHFVYHCCQLCQKYNTSLITFDNIYTILEKMIGNNMIYGYGNDCDNDIILTANDSYILTHEWIPIDKKIIEKYLAKLDSQKHSYLNYLSIETQKQIIDQCIRTTVLKSLRLLLQTVGCNSMIKNNQLIICPMNFMNLLKVSYQHMKSQKTNCQQCLSTLETFNNIEFVNIHIHKHNSFDVSVVNILNLEMPEDTFCFNEPKRHMGIFNGIIAGNCAEIVEVSTSKEYSVCSLSSICLPKYVKIIDNKPTFDYEHLYQVTRIVTNNLNKIIDINFYPVDKTRVSNLRHRPIGIGVQGLADVFAMFKIPFDSLEAREINKKIFETIYFGALTESNYLSMKYGPYETYYLNGGCPLSKGIFQFDMWGIDRKNLSGMWDWDGLQKQIMTYGVRNSLTTSCMPTASTAQINGNNESTEPYTENIYSRSTSAGDYYIINKYLMQDLIDLGLWNLQMIDLIKYHNGSIQQIKGIPDNIKKIYRTVWEIDQMSIIEMAADRAPFIDQTQSMNLFIAKASFAKLNTCLFYSWKKGLKTGIYYLRSKAASEASQFGIDINKIKEIESEYNKVKICQFVPKHLRKPGDCMQCDG